VRPVREEKTQEGGASATVATGVGAFRRRENVSGGGLGEKKMRWGVASKIGRGKMKLKRKGVTARNKRRGRGGDPRKALIW